MRLRGRRKQEKSRRLHQKPRRRVPGSRHGVSLLRRRQSPEIQTLGGKAVSKTMEIQSRVCAQYIPKR